MKIQFKQPDRNQLTAEQLRVVEFIEWTLDFRYEDCKTADFIHRYIEDAKTEYSKIKRRRTANRDYDYGDFTSTFEEWGMDAFDFGMQSWGDS